MASFAVIFPAAGLSSRFGENKLVADLAGQPVIVRSINAFLPRDDVSEIVIATRDRTTIEETIGRLDHADAILGSRKLRWCSGGETRAHTVRLAARATRAEWIAIPDAARPLVTPELIDRTFAAAVADGAAAPAMPVSLTMKESRGPLPAPIIRTVPRDTLWAMQTPQCMRRDDLLNAFENCGVPLEQITDDVQLLELARRSVTLVAGEERNLKITTPLDLRVASLLLSNDA